MTPARQLSVTDVRTFLRQRVAAKRGLSDPAPRGCDEPLAERGIGSRGAGGLAAGLEDFVGTEVSEMELYDHPTVNALARRFGASPEE